MVNIGIMIILQDAAIFHITGVIRIDTANSNVLAFSFNLFWLFILILFFPPVVPASIAFWVVISIESPGPRVFPQPNPSAPASMQASAMAM